VSTLPRSSWAPRLPALGQSICSSCCGTKRWSRCNVQVTAWLSGERPQHSCGRHRSAAPERPRTAHTTSCATLNEHSRSCSFWSARASGATNRDLQPLMTMTWRTGGGTRATRRPLRGASSISTGRPRFRPIVLQRRSKPLLAEARKSGGSAFERTPRCARRSEEAARGVRRLDPSEQARVVDFLGRLTRSVTIRLWTRTAGRDPDRRFDRP